MWLPLLLAASLPLSHSSPPRRLLFGRLSNRSDADDACLDAQPECATWATAGECAANAAFMHLHCRRSCAVCRAATPPSSLPPRPACDDELGYDCAARAARGECHASRNATAARCMRSCGLCGFSALLRQAASCEDSHPTCAHWAASGECTANPGFMEGTCAASCAVCEAKRRACDRAEGGAAVAAGGVGETMRRLLRDFPSYAPRALSQPTDAQPDAPWVVTLDRFLNDSEADAFIHTCSDHFERSLAGDALSPVRTSFQCWCSQNACDGHPITEAVARRISDLVRAPVRYFEPFQVLRYEEGQFYRTHHDQNSGLFTPQGPRVYTFFMYLSTPEAGGGTRFNDLGITVPAIKGNAVIWPSVMDRNPDVDEPRTRHESVPVESGVKYASNIWVHNYDYRTPSGKNCALTHKNTH